MIQPLGVFIEEHIFASSDYFPLYEGHLESKERFAIQIFIDNTKETEYAGFITHFHLLLHIVTLDIEALVVP